MPGGFPLGLEICNVQDIGTTTTSSGGTSVSESANTKSAWTQLNASISYDVSWLYLSLFDSGSGTQTSIFDVGYGPSGSEVAVLNNISFVAGTGGEGGDMTFPVHIPAGSRLVARGQSATSRSINIRCSAFDGAFTHQEGYAGAEGVGVNLSTSLPTAVAPSATANTKGSWVQLIASTARDYAGYKIIADLLNNQSGVTGKYLIDIAIGASGSEVVIDPNMEAFIKVSNEIDPLGGFDFKPIVIPKGSRIAARCQCSATSGSTIGINLVGFYQ